MASPIELVRRFCAGRSDNIATAELAAFFTDDAVYHNIPPEPVTGRDAVASMIDSFIRPRGSSRSLTARSTPGGTTST